MNKFIILTFILFVSLNLFSQEEYVKLPHAKTQKPSYIFNKNIIGNPYLIKSLGTSMEEIKEKVDEMSVLKDIGNRESNEYYNLTEYGIVFMDMKESPNSKTQTELNEFFGLDKQTQIYIDGYLLENKKYRIALTGIAEIEVIEPDNANRLKSTTLNIWTFKESQRYREKTP